MKKFRSLYKLGKYRIKKYRTFAKTSLLRGAFPFKRAKYFKYKNKFYKNDHPGEY